MSQLSPVSWFRSPETSFSDPDFFTLTVELMMESVQFSHSVVSDSLEPHGLQQTSLPCPSPTPGASSNSSESVMPSNNLILCHPIFLLPSILPSMGVFSSESVLRIRWPKYWSFSFSISPSNEYSGLISFRIDWFDLFYTVK